MFPGIEYIKTALNAIMCRFHSIQSNLDAVKSNLDAVKSDAPDWNELDSTSHAYIKNKPFYEYSYLLVDVDCTANTHVEISCDLVLGDTYIVCIDGVCYEKIAYEEYGSGQTILTLGSEDGSSSYIMIRTYEITADSDCHVSVSKYYKKNIDSKFVDNTCFEVNMVSDTAGIIVSDRTIGEIYAAYNSGRFVYCIYGSYVYNLSLCSNSECSFYNINAYSGDMRMLIYSREAIRYEIHKLPSRTSDLYNDSGFLTVIPDEYITEAEFSKKLEDEVTSTIPIMEQHAESAANSARIASDCAQAMAGTYDFTGYLRYKIVETAPETYDEGVLYIVTST